MARRHTEFALNTLRGIAGSKGVEPGVRVQAANAILDRGWGKPAGDVGEGAGEIRVIIRQLVQPIETAHHGPPLLDLEPIEQDDSER